MKRIARLTLLAFFLVSNAFAQPPVAGEKKNTTSSEGLEMITERMKSLSRGLNQMPGPPDMDEKIMIPDLGPLSKPKKERQSGNP